ncbi:MAG: phage holin family protein [Actinomycetota bacterium]|nr:phage holin family protein [Actinomycetota bacterium]
MLRWILDWVIMTFSIAVASYFLPLVAIMGDTTGEKFRIAFLAGLLLGLLHTFIKPIVKFLSLPINILTLGLFNIVINAGMLWIVDYFLSGLKVNGFWGYVVSSVLISIISIVLTKIIYYERRKRK